MGHQADPHGRSGTPAVTEAFERFFHSQVNGSVVLMFLFFFVVGLEIKREFVLGHLSSMRQAVLPITAAVGGMAVPAHDACVIRLDGHRHGAFSGRAKTS